MEKIVCLEKYTVFLDGLSWLLTVHFSLGFYELQAVVSSLQGLSSELCRAFQVQGVFQNARGTREDKEKYLILHPGVICCDMVWFVRDQQDLGGEESCQKHNLCQVD